jgi:YHS domain-containing protein
MFRHTARSILPLRPIAALTLAMAGWCAADADQPATPATAATPPWHADLAQARGAAATSQRPVLVLYVATWSEESRQIVAGVQASAEATALIGACFEPVVMDVDSDPELTRRLEISHVPTAVVLGPDTAKLAAFECPAAVPAFIAATGQAARDATARAAAPLAATTPAAAPDTGTPHDAQARGSISMLTAKVRHLSSFAGDAGQALGAPALGTPVTRPADLQASFAHATPPATQEPALARVPPTWAAERPATPLALSSAAPATPRPAIEPVTQANAVQATATPAATPWLNSLPEPETTASVSDLPATTPPTATPASPPKPANSFWAALQKPFTAASRAPAGTPVKPEPPPTMPPARPQWPGALAATPTAPAATPPAAPTSAPAAAAAEPSMPLGLEGYCAVTLVEKQVWTEGRPQFGVRHRGRTYLFAGLAQQQAFLADPDRYAPALSGDDPVLAFEQGKAMPGQRRYGVVCQSRMYLFATPETRDAFAANPEKYAGRVALAEQGATAATRFY